MAASECKGNHGAIMGGDARREAGADVTMAERSTALAMRITSKAYYFPPALFRRWDMYQWSAVSYFRRSGSSVPGRVSRHLEPGFTY